MGHSPLLEPGPPPLIWITDNSDDVDEMDYIIFERSLLKKESET